VSTVDGIGPSAEDRLIARHFRPLARHPGALALGDDAAFFAPPEGCDLVLTKDMIVGGVHFFPDDPPDTIARKALRVNLSDLAAKGAAPAGFLLALGLTASADEDWLAAFSAGLGADADRYGCPLLGGDTVRSPGPIIVSVTAFGTLPRDSMVRRAGARVGDRILVTGTIGDAALGLALRQRAENAMTWRLSTAAQTHLAGRYLLPEPRTDFAAAVRAHASAAMDVSDGLAGDLAKLCRESGVSAEIEAAQVPLSSAAREALETDPDAMRLALTGGDDYEILLTASPGSIAPLMVCAAAAGIALTEIGCATADTGKPRFVDPAGRPLELGKGSFSHF
jgi:thiamine-monophosphate kinase